MTTCPTPRSCVKPDPKLFGQPCEARSATTGEPICSRKATYACVMPDGEQIPICKGHRCARCKEIPPSQPSSNDQEKKP